MMLTYLAIAILLFIAWVVIYTYIASRSTAPEDVEFFLANRILKGWRQVLTFWATLFSAGVFVGASGLFYQHGIGTAVFMSAAYVGIGVAIPVLGTPLWRMAQQRFSQTGERRTSPFDIFFSHSDRSFLVEWVAILTTVLFLVPYLTMQMAGIGKLLQGVFGIPYFLICILVLLTIMSYSLVGGLPKIVVTDIVQALATIFFVIGGAAIFYSMHWDFSISGASDFFTSSVEHEGGALWKVPESNGFFTVSTLIGLIVMHWFIPVTQPQLASRIVATRPGESFKKLGFWVGAAAMIALVPTFIFGMGGALVFSGLDSGDKILGAIVEDIGSLPGALLLFGIFLATLSTTDSILLGVSNVVSDGMSQVLPKDSTSPIKRRQFTMILVGLAALILSYNPPELIATLAFLSVGGTLQLAPILILALMRVDCHWIFQILSPIAGGLVVLFFRDFGLGEFISWHPAMVGVLIAGILAGTGAFVTFGLRQITSR